MIAILQHVPYESPGWILDWIVGRGIDHRLVDPFRGQSLPDPEDIRGLVVMGGSMNVYEEHLHPWLAQEKQLIRACIDDGKKVLGICLGAQLVAASLGARVRRNAALEVGWFPVDINHSRLTPFLDGVFPARFATFHWHGDTFEVPAGGRAFASSEGCTNQGFVLGHHVLAMQFHPEIKEEGIEDLIANDADDLLSESVFVQTAGEIRSGTAHIAENREILFRIMDAFFNERAGDE